MPDRPRRPNPSTALPDAGRALLEFLKTEGGGGVVLLVAGVVALVWANSPWQDAYHDLWHHEIGIGPAGWALQASLQPSEAWWFRSFSSGPWPVPGKRLGGGRRARR